jgi:hypothetical protein
MGCKLGEMADLSGFFHLQMSSAGPNHPREIAINCSTSYAKMMITLLSKATTGELTGGIPNFFTANYFPLSETLFVQNLDHQSPRDKIRSFGWSFCSFIFNNILLRGSSVKPILIRRQRDSAPDIRL